MPYGLYLSAEGAQAQSRRLEAIANNMANANTVGFKPDVALFQSRFAEAIQQNQAVPGIGGPNDIGGGVKAIETVTNFAPGKLQKTGNAADLAIIGQGFFQVAAPGGEALLTRAGNFSVDSQNRLVMAGSNMPVLDAGGSAIELDPALPWGVSPGGSIEQAGELTPLAIVEPESLGDLQKAGANLFRSRSEPLPVAPQNREVRQYFLEMSGANPTTEMMSMIETSRAFEANTKMIQNHDQMLSGLVNRVLSV
ncbi:Flagellar basal-body rod protein FlgG [Pseudobythopirellula maris]|uniref:Flagellar basal-body rod protein FlgG n=1 Tax=Pseudobythopirellula maris TaxID=2527991 RepID=A0A5C5ZMA4_9BACT|nr:flagellar hook-basal body protein [Pseudobythopirellula maris]TWT88226.1 Flagellar basal-body rod protein FlgG [Pseudobythopirellula maris]